MTSEPLPAADEVHAAFTASIAKEMETIVQVHPEGVSVKIANETVERALYQWIQFYGDGDWSDTDRNAMRAALEAVLPDLQALQFTPEELHHLATRHDACSICREIRQRLAKES